METERQKQLRADIHEVSSAIAGFTVTHHMPMRNVFLALAQLNEKFERYFDEIPSSELSESEQAYLRDSMMRHVNERK